MRKITLYSLDDYNNGLIIPFTIELDNLNFQQFQAEIQKQLQKIDQEQGGGSRERWKVATYENIPSDFIGEYCLDKAFFDYLDKLRNSKIDETIFQAGIECGLSLEDIENCYRGKFESDTAFTEKYIQEHNILEKIPAELRDYFDRKAYCKDIMRQHDAANGFYFSIK